MDALSPHPNCFHHFISLYLSPLSIGLGLLVVVFERIYLGTGNNIYEQTTMFWIKVFALIFGIGGQNNNRINKIENTKMFPGERYKFKKIRSKTNRAA